MNFCSDNVTGLAPEILAALTAAADGAAMPYGGDDLTAGLDAKFSEVFETEVTVFLVATGTAANALALSVMTPPYGVVYCHADAHIQCHECGAPEFFTGGAKLVPLDGSEGKISAADLGAVLAAGKQDVHHVPPATVSLTQASEAGTLYTPDEIGAIADITGRFGLKLHMDGARFANAVAALGCAPAEITWRAGIDVLCFGATKNGALAAEAVVFFDHECAKDFGFRRKRGGHLISKMRFLAAQFDAYLTDDLWLRLAAQANRMAERLAEGLSRLQGVAIHYPVQSNQIFVTLPNPVIHGLLDDGFLFYRLDGVVPNLIRLVTAFDTKEEDVDAFLASSRRHAGPAHESRR